MAEQTSVEVNSDNKNNEFPRDYIEKRLLESLDFLYESSRIAKDINAEETKLTNFRDIKNKLTHDDHKPLAALENIDSNINKVIEDINKMKSKMGEAEQKVVRGFHDILTNMLELSERKASVSSNGFKTALERFEHKMTETFGRQLAELDRKVQELKTTKLDASIKESIITRVEEIKTRIINVQKANISKISQATEEQYKAVERRVEEKLNNLDYSSVVSEVQQNISQNLESKMKEYLEQTNQYVNKLNQQPLSDKMKEYIDKEITNQVGPVNLQKIILSLPEYQLMKQMLENKEKNVNVSLDQSPEFHAMNSAITDMSKDLTQLKQVTNSTRSVVDTLKQQGLPTESLIVNFDHTASVKHIETMEREISAMYNSIKRIESTVDTDSSSVFDMSPSRKRARLEDQDTRNKSDLLSRLDDIEAKQQKLQDYIFQCKDTVLDDDFPARLDAAMTRIQHILVNHETFLSFLVDPFSTVQKIKAAHTDKIDSAEKLNPATLSAISQLIQKTADEMTLPLQKRIKSLEEKLERKN